MSLRALAFGLLFALRQAPAPPPAAKATPLPIALDRKDDRVVVTAGGKPFTAYRWSGDTKPFLYPVLAPTGAHATRRWPEEDVPGEEHDHPHHRGMWFAHGDVNGADFWTGEGGASRIESTELIATEDGATEGRLRVKHRWIHEGAPLLDDERTLRFAATDDVRIVDLDVTLTAAYGDVTFGDTKEGTMAIRLAEPLRVKPATEGAAHGACRNSEGVAGAEIWGKRARFVDDFGAVDGGPIGVALFDHPENPRHPTWWHARDYGLFAANPFGVHDFEGKEKGTGDLKLAKGERLRLRYRVAIYRGEKTLEAVAALAPPAS